MREVPVASTGRPKSGTQHPCKSWAQWLLCNPSAGVGEVGGPWSYRSVSTAESLSFELRESSCLKINGGEQHRKVANVNL